MGVKAVRPQTAGTRAYRGYPPLRPQRKSPLQSPNNFASGLNTRRAGLERFDYLDGVELQEAKLSTHVDIRFQASLKV